MFCDDVSGLCLTDLLLFFGGSMGGAVGLCGAGDVGVGGSSIEGKVLATDLLDRRR